MYSPSQSDTSVSMSDPALILSQRLAAGVPETAQELPWVIESGEVKTPRDLAFWLETIVTEGPAYHDSIYLISAYEAANEQVLSALSDLYLAYGHSAKRRAEITYQGQVFSRRVRRMHGMDVAHLAYPVAVGATASRLGAPYDMTIRMYLETFLARHVAAAATRIGLNKNAQREAMDTVRPHIATLSKSGQKMPTSTAPKLSEVPAWMTSLDDAWALPGKRA